MVFLFGVPLRLLLLEFSAISVEADASIFFVDLTEVVHLLD